MARENKFKKFAQDIKPSAFSHPLDFLKALYVHLKENIAGYSYLKFSDDLGLGPCNASRLIISGKRPLTEKAARKISDSIGLKKIERRFFLEMVVAHRSGNTETKKDKLSRMVEQKKLLTSDAQVRDQLSFFAEWYHAAILELMRTEDAASDVGWIAERLVRKVTPKKISESLVLLQKLGYLIFQPEAGKFVVTAKQVHTASEVQGLAYMRFHQQSIDLASDALTRLGASERYVTSLTIGTSEETRRKIAKLMRNFLEDIAEMIEADAGVSDEVSQINLQSFPVARPPMRKR